MARVRRQVMRRELASGSRLQVLACASGCDMAFAGEEQSARLVNGNQSNDDHSNVITNVVDHYASSRGGAHLGRLEIVGGLLDGLAGASLCDWFGGAQQSRRRRRRRLTSRAMKTAQQNCMLHRIFTDWSSAASQSQSIISVSCSATFV